MFRLDKPLERCSGDYSQSGWLSCLEGVYKERGGGCRFPWEEEEVKGDPVCSAEATHRRLTSAEEWLWWQNDEVIVKVRNKIQAF